MDPDGKSLGHGTNTKKNYMFFETTWVHWLNCQVFVLLKSDCTNVLKSDSPVPWAESSIAESARNQGLVRSKIFNRRTRSICMWAEPPTLHLIEPGSNGRCVEWWLPGCGRCIFELLLAHKNTPFAPKRKLGFQPQCFRCEKCLVGGFNTFQKY